MVANPALAEGELASRFSCEITAKPSNGIEGRVAVERQVFQLVRGDRLSGRRPDGLQRSRIGCDRDRFGRRAYREDDLLRNPGVGVNLDAFL